MIDEWLDLALRTMNSVTVSNVIVNRHNRRVFPSLSKVTITLIRKLPCPDSSKISSLHRSWCCSENCNLGGIQKLRKQLGVGGWSVNCLCLKHRLPYLIY